MRLASPVVLLLFFSACAYAQETVSFCDLVRNPEKYNEKTVTVRATLSIGFEWSLLHCLECPDRGKAWLELPSDLDDDIASMKALRRIPGAGIVNLTVTGRFQSGGTYGHMNSCRYQLTAEKVRDVVVLSKGMKKPEKEHEIEKRFACGGANPK